MHTAAPFRETRLRTVGTYEDGRFSHSERGCYPSAAVTGLDKAIRSLIRRRGALKEEVLMLNVFIVS